jgi:hypothetical protein
MPSQGLAAPEARGLRPPVGYAAQNLHRQQRQAFYRPIKDETLAFFWQFG